MAARPAAAPVRAGAFRYGPVVVVVRGALSISTSAFVSPSSRGAPGPHIPLTGARGPARTADGVPPVGGGALFTRGSRGRCPRVTTSPCRAAEVRLRRAGPARPGRLPYESPDGSYDI